MMRMGCTWMESRANMQMEPTQAGKSVHERLRAHSDGVYWLYTLPPCTQGAEDSIEHKTVAGLMELMILSG